jgi:hypothetical protein
MSVLFGASATMDLLRDPVVRRSDLLDARTMHCCCPRSGQIGGVSGQNRARAAEFLGARYRSRRLLHDGATPQNARSKGYERDRRLFSGSQALVLTSGAIVRITDLKR